MPRRRVAVAALFGLVVLVAGPAAAGADVGAGVGASPIALGSTAQPGHTYQLPALYVVNTGTVTSTYHFKVERVGVGAGITVPPSWVRFGRNDVRLVAKKTASIPLTLSVPTGASIGSYVSDIIAGTVAARGHGAAIVGAQAATELEFQVGGGGGFPWPWPGWVYGVAGGAAALVLVVWAQRRYGIRVHLERR